MANQFEMKTLYNKIIALGFKKKDIQAILPEWWNDNIAKTQSGFLEAAVLLSKSLSINLKSLISEEKACFDLPLSNFKAKGNINTAELDIAVALSTVAAKATLRGFSAEKRYDGLTAKKVRETLLSRGNKWIDFRTLVEFCWEIGIPVLHLNLKNYKKMQGLAIEINNRPVIILTSQHKYGYLVFDLAHELGHILAEHTKDSIVVDERISPKGIEKNEKEANDIALEILTGSTYHFTTRSRNASSIAEACISTGKERNIDPAHLVLNIGHSMDNWVLANSALKIIKEKLNISSNDPAICKEVMLERLDFETMGDFKHPMRVITSSLNKAA
ncbi:ImmA/IrrE family metallo-endopeptidase [Actinobacillus porcinus]|uniref:ImmA/IrrE family metallo-endopeptidase n=1 Tax=Actinobacillus porcinus TaxID=51048 RepID=UPI002A90DB4F|nr:ImmA/IrrE family metallo-endopeptidase [Actinobacillus porcinus]MDY5847516.1 ImmA/IrrE family metallo-endopeptidase [Actinobacillus porcinus]